MSDSEKIKITVPESTKSVLECDARQFELLKKDSRTININRLLNLIVENYYNCYNDMLDKKRTLILEQMKEFHLNDHQAEELARAIISNVFLPQISKEKVTVKYPAPHKISDPARNQHPCRVKFIHRH